MNFKALTTTVYMYGDDKITLYVDGLELLNSTHPNVSSTNISTASSLLAIRVFNSPSGFTGALLSFTFGGCITDTVTWRCTGSYYPEWNKIDYDDISWPLANSLYGNRDNKGRPQFSANCSMIAYYSNYRPDNYTFYCRHWLN